MNIKKHILTIFILFTLKNSQIQSSWVQETLKYLTLEEKIGQLFIAAHVINPDMSDEKIKNIVNNIDQSPIETLIQKYHIGGVLYLGKTTTPKEQCDITNKLQKISKLPLFIAQDLEWGLNMRLKNTVKFPYNMTLGAIKNNNLIYQMGKEIGRQCKLIGVNLNFAPVVDINNNPKNPIINKRSFGENKYLVAQKSIAFMHGLQDAGIIACAKHFPGHGNTSIDSHLDLPKINQNWKQLQNTELYPFKKIINAGIKSVMIGHLEIPALEKTPNIPATLSHNITTNLLKNNLKFTGLIITDALNMQGVLKYHKPGKIELKALLAGNDILLCSKNTPQAIANITQSIKNNIISEEELDIHVIKILKAKQWLTQNKTETYSPIEIDKNLNTSYIYKLKKQLYREAITLVRNKKNTLPLTQDKISPEPVAYIQIGKENTDKAFFSTLEKNIPIKKYCISQKTKNLLLSLENYKTIIIGVYGINIYAHNNFGISQHNINFIKRLQNNNIILVLFGSPYSLELFNSMKHISSIIVSYEDETDAQIATGEVIVGKIKPKGKLPIFNSQ